MRTGAETYKDASSEHVLVAIDLYDAGHYVMAHYCAGLAVECILRAYQVRLKAEFDSKHDLKKLSHDAKFSKIFPESRAAEYESLFTNLARRWNNDFRFRSVKSLRRYLVRLKLHEKVKGDFVKESARVIVNAATILVQIGVSKWMP